MYTWWSYPLYTENFRKMSKIKSTMNSISLLGQTWLTTSFQILRTWTQQKHVLNIYLPTKKSVREIESCTFFSVLGWYIKMYLWSRVTRWVWEKVTQNVAQPILCQNILLKLFLKRLPGVGSEPGSSRFHLFSHFSPLYRWATAAPRFCLNLTIE
jgi:hypothetical protein